MSRETYEVVEHDGGWAYKADGATSETFATHAEAHRAAERAAAAQRAPGEDTDITYEDAGGDLRSEHASGADRPETDVKD